MLHSIGIQSFRQIFIAEFSPYQIPCMNQAPNTHKTLVFAVFLIISYTPSFLTRNIGATMNRASRDPDDPIQTDSLFHKHIQHAGRIDAPHPAAFQDQTCFHLTSIPFPSLVRFPVPAPVSSGWRLPAIWRRADSSGSRCRTRLWRPG